ncbi:MAG TPA: hypothetical protein VN922_21285, partial [Bacteroidia bacterium]|nr:hypothetical protein [Bacteroidia bacterium]
MNAIKEITKTNNSLSKVTLSISSGDIIPVYPYSFAIIPKDTATLKASTSNPFASAHNYIFEIDTTIYFNSPFLRAQVINAKGGVVRASWKNWVNTPNGLPTFPNNLGAPTSLKFKDSTVYYWRARRDTSDMKDYGWQVNSFQYIKGKSGWGQSHYFQFDNNQYTFMEQQMKKRNWIFDSTGKTLTCQTYGNPNDSSLLAFETGYYFDYNIGSYGGCQFFPGLYMAVIDSTSLNQWSTLYHKLGNDNGAGSGCNYPFGMFIYWFNDPNAMPSMFTAIKDSVPNGDYILIWSWVEGQLKTSVPLALKNYLVTNLGCSPAINASNITDTVPFIFFAKKGSPSTAKTLIGKNKRDRLTLRTDLR